MFRSKTSSTTLLGLALLGASVFAQAAGWTATDIGQRGILMYPRAINLNGDVVGSYLTAQYEHRAFLYRAGRLVDATGTGRSTGAHDINDAGTIVGYLGSNDNFRPLYLDGSGPHLFNTLDGYISAVNNQGKMVANLRLQGGIAYQPVIYDPSTGQYQSGPPWYGVESQYATDINDSGEVVGSYDINWGRGTMAFVWRGGAVTRLDTGPNRWNGAAAINQAGHIIAWGINDFDPEHEPDFGDAYFHANDHMTQLPNLAGFGSQPTAINNADMIVGWSEVSWTFQDQTYSSVKHAVLWQGANSVQDLNTLVRHPDANNGAYFEMAHAINDRGQVVVTDNRRRTWLLSPPAPESARILERARLVRRSAR